MLAHLATDRSPACPLWLGGLLLMAFTTTACYAESDRPMRVIGATADLVEESTGLRMTARIDTGATTCSIHAEDIEVEEGGKSMIKNIGKKIRFQLTGGDGEKKQVETVIADTVRVRTSVGKERRYKVWLELRHQDVKRRVSVTLNDRSKMAYPLLVGRNFLTGRFLVDVATKHTPAEGPEEAVEKVAVAAE